MIFSNYKKLADSLQRKKILDLADVGIHAVLPKQFMHKSVTVDRDILCVRNKTFNIKDRRIFVIGAGKASVTMALELERILGIDRITAGIIVSNDTATKLSKVAVHYADHPIPSKRGIAGAKKVFDLKTKFNLNEHDLIVALVSGGASALMPYPVNGVSLEDKRKLFETFLRSGASGIEFSLVRKKISQIKGGGLAKYFHPIPVISLILSDTVGDDFTPTAGGPFTKDNTTIADAWRIIEHYGIKDSIPLTIRSYFKKRIFEEKITDFSHVHQVAASENNHALEAIKKRARRYGMKVHVEKNIGGEAKETAVRICEKIGKYSVKTPTLYLYGGETTVTLPEKHGVGGRNQEFVLSCLEYLRARQFPMPWAIASLGTDGVDFIPEAAGALVDSETIKDAD